MGLLRRQESEDELKHIAVCSLLVLLERVETNRKSMND